MYWHQKGGGQEGVIMTNVLNYVLEVSDFKLYSCYYIHFWYNTLGKGINALIPPARG